MMDKNQINKIKETAEDFFSKMTTSVSKIDADVSSIKKETAESEGGNQELKEVVNLDIKLEEPQILIGQGGQTLFEIQRLLRMILNRKLKDAFYLNLDINDYKKKKIEYLKKLARELADEAALAKQEKSLLPMPSYERRIIHAELSGRTDIATESRGDGPERHIVIKPR